MHWALPLALLSLGADTEPQRLGRIYDIRFLTAAIPQFPVGTWPEAGRLVLAGSGGIRDEDPLDDWARGGSVSLDTGESELTHGMGLDPDALVELIQKNIAEDSWANSRNAIGTTETELTVVHTAPVQEAIQALLSRLRERRALMTRVDVAVVPDGALEPFRDGDAIWLPKGALEGAVAAAGEAGTVVSLTAYNHQTVSGFSGRKRSKLVDTEVNQTGALPVANPVIAEVPVGVTVEALPRALAGTESYRLKLQVERLREVSPPETCKTFFADLEFQVMEEHSLRTELILPPHRTAIGGSLRVSGGASGFTVLVRLTPYAPQNAAAAESTPGETAIEDAAPPSEEFTQRFCDVGFLVAGDKDTSPRFDANRLVGQILYKVDPEAWRDERTAIDFDVRRAVLAVTARSATHDAVQAFLDAQTAAFARLSVVEVWEVEGPVESVYAVAEASAGEQAGLLAQLRRNEGPLRERVHVLTVGIVGSLARLDGYTAHPFLGDVEVASGGTGFAVLEFPDPVVESLGDGVRLQVRVQSTSRDELARLDLAYGRYEAALERSARFVTTGAIGAGRLPPTSFPVDNTLAQLGPQVDAGTRTMWVPWEVDLPAQRNAGVALTHVTPLGVPRLLRVSSAEGGNARAILARIRYAPVSTEDE